MILKIDVIPPFIFVFFMLKNYSRLTSISLSVYLKRIRFYEKIPPSCV